MSIDLKLTSLLINRDPVAVYDYLDLIGPECIERVVDHHEISEVYDVGLDSSLFDMAWFSPHLFVRNIHIDVLTDHKIAIKLQSLNTIGPVKIVDDGCHISINARWIINDCYEYLDSTDEDQDDVEREKNYKFMQVFDPIGQLLHNHIKLPLKFTISYDQVIMNGQVYALNVYKGSKVKRKI